MEPAFKRVYAIRDWYDGPRDGAADFRGVPHRFRSVYLDTEQWHPDEDRFELTPLPPHVLPWMVEAHELWQRYLAALRAGTAPELPQDSPGVLPEDRARYEKLERWIDASLAELQPAVLAHGEFSLRDANVRWVPVGERPAI
jgi:hypothetical protein